MGWMELYTNIAKANETMAQKAIAVGDEQGAQKFQSEAMKYRAKAIESKGERFKKGVAKIGSIVVGGVSSLLSGAGVSGVAQSFLQNTYSTGINPGVDVRTPPIVQPGTETESEPDTGSRFWSTGHWVPFAIVLVIVFRKKLFKIFS